MIERALTAVQWILFVVLVVSVGVLGRLIVARLKRRHVRSYITSLRFRGLELLFSSEDPDVMSGLQLLSRFGLPTPIPQSVLARVIDLTRSTNGALAELALRTLRRLSEAPSMKEERLAGPTKSFGV